MYNKIFSILIPSDLIIIVFDQVVFLNRSPNSHKNGTWFHLDVHAPPRFSVTPEEIIYVNIGKANYVILCKTIIFKLLFIFLTIVILDKYSFPCLIWP